MRWLIATLLLAPPVFGQCDHESNSLERFENMRVRPPVQILNWDGREMRVTFSDKFAIYHETYVSDEKSKLELQGFKHGSKDFYWVLIDICSRDQEKRIAGYLYTVTPAVAGQIKK